MKLKFFSPAPRPANEAERQATLDATGALDRRGEPAFDALAREAADRFGAPIAAISLVDRDRQFFVGEVGLGASETSRSVSFCAHAIHGDRPFVVPDATADSRFEGNPLVTNAAPGVRFYAGAPLTASNGHNLGAMCVIDTKARLPLTPEEEAALADLAERAVRLIERRD